MMTTAKRVTRARPAPARKKRGTVKAARRPKSRRPSREPSPEPLPALPSLAEQLNDQSDQIGKAASIIFVCRQSCASLYRTDEEEFMVPALEAVMDMLGGVMSRLEGIATADAGIEA